MDKPLYERHGSLGHEQHDHGRQTNMKFALVLGGSKRADELLMLLLISIIAAPTAKIYFYHSATPTWRRRVQ